MERRNCKSIRKLRTATNFNAVNLPHTSPENKSTTENHVPNVIVDQLMEENSQL